jgi:hypothetical protein
MENRGKAVVRGVVAVGALYAMAMGMNALVSSAEAKGPNPCPLIYAPVICDHGKIYPNQCEADRHHAKNCEPYPIF